MGQQGQHTNGYSPLMLCLSEFDKPSLKSQLPQVS